MRVYISAYEQRGKTQTGRGREKKMESPQVIID